MRVFNVFLFIFLPVSLFGATYTVTSSSACGAGSFMEAISNANSNPGTDRIEFASGLTEIIADGCMMAPPDFDEFFLAKITESVDIIGIDDLDPGTPKKDRLRFIGHNQWISKSGTLNPDRCPLSSDIFVNQVAGLLAVGTYGADNSTITVNMSNIDVDGLTALAFINKSATLNISDGSFTNMLSSHRSCTHSIINVKDGGKLDIERTYFYHNKVMASYDMHYMWFGLITAGANSSVTIQDSDFFNNHTAGFISQSGGTLDIINSKIDNSEGIGATNTATRIVNTAIYTQNFAYGSTHDGVHLYGGSILLDAVSIYVPAWSHAHSPDDSAGYTSNNVHFSARGGAVVTITDSAIGALAASSTLLPLSYTTGAGSVSVTRSWVRDGSLPGADDTIPGLSDTIFFLADLIPDHDGVLVDASVGTPLINPVTGFEITTDVLGNPRLSGATRDIGAVEVVGCLAHTDCSALDDQCSTGYCNTTLGYCIREFSSKDGDSCDDGHYCTENETCDNGSCKDGAARDCSNLDNQCNSGICNELTDQCHQVQIADDTPCDDTLFCTANDTCQSGTCTGGAQPDCDDGNVCTADVCDENSKACENHVIAGCNTNDDDIITNDIDAMMDNDQIMSDGDTIVSDEDTDLSISDADTVVMDDDDLTDTDNVIQDNEVVSDLDQDTVIENDNDTESNDNDEKNDMDSIYLFGGGCGCSIVVEAENDSKHSIMLLSIFGIILSLYLALKSRKKKRGKLLGFLLLLMVFFLPKPSHAQIKIPADNFKPSTSPYSLYMTESGKLLPHLSFSGGLIFNYDHHPLIMWDNENNKVSSMPLEHRVDMNVLAGFGLWNRLELGLALPVSLYQKSDDKSIDQGILNSSAGTAMGDLRFIAKVRLFTVKSFTMSVALPLSFPTGNRENLTGEDGVTFSPKLIAGLSTSFLSVFLNAGFLIRKDQSLNLGTGQGKIVVDDEFLLAAGTLIPVWKKHIDLFADFNMSMALKEQDSEELGFDLIGGAKFYLPLGFQANIGIGPGLGRGIGTPQFRAIAGISYTYTPKKKKPKKKTAKEPPKKKEPLKTPKKMEKTEKKPQKKEAPEKDSDNDGIPDSVDKCKDKPEVFNGIEDEDGCPDKAEKEVHIKESMIHTPVLHFDVDKDIEDSQSHEHLQEVVKLLKDNLWIKKLIIEGYADSIGPSKYNKDLSIKRAEHVRKYLIKHGIKASRLQIKGFGEKDAADTNKTEEGRYRNRRVIFHIMN